MSKEKLYEAMEDWDNSELDDYERDEQLMDQVQTFNERNGTNYDKRKELSAYKRWRWHKYSPLIER